MVATTNPDLNAALSWFEHDPVPVVERQTDSALLSNQLAWTAPMARLEQSPGETVYGMVDAFVIHRLGKHDAPLSSGQDRIRPPTLRTLPDSAVRPGHHLLSALGDE
jgi:hypothetical protein